jgi:hypothetical protein
MGDKLPDANLRDPAALQNTIAQLVGLVAGLQTEVQSIKNNITPTPIVPEATQSSSSTPPTTEAPSVGGVKTVKLPQPKGFNGSGMVENFLFDCEQYFAGMSIPADKQVFFAAGLLDGSPKSWWRYLCESYGSDRLHELYVWDTFRALLMSRFKAVNASRHARDQLAELKQTSNVRTYAHKMQDLAMQIPNMHDEELMDKFIRGLKPRTRQEVVMREPYSFEQAVQLADRYDSLFSPGFGFNRQPSGTNTSYLRPPVLTPVANPSSSGPFPMEIGMVKRRNAPLTPEERDRLRKIGGCFYCRQPGHIAPNCPNGKLALQRPRVNNIQTPGADTEQPDLIDFSDEPRSLKNSMPQ